MNRDPRGDDTGHDEELAVKRGHLRAGIVGLPCAHTRPSPFVSHCCPGRKGRQAGTLDTSRQCETAFTPGTVTCTLALRNARIYIVCICICMVIKKSFDPFDIASRIRSSIFLTRRTSFVDGRITTAIDSSLVVCLYTKSIVRVRK